MSTTSYAAAERDRLRAVNAELLAALRDLTPLADAYATAAVGGTVAGAHTGAERLAGRELPGLIDAIRAARIAIAKAEQEG